MTQAEYNSYRFDSQNDPSDEQLGQLMENAAKKVRETNRESDVNFIRSLDAQATKQKAAPLNLRIHEKKGHAQNILPKT